MNLSTVLKMKDTTAYSANMCRNESKFIYLSKNSQHISIYVN